MTGGKTQGKAAVRAALPTDSGAIVAMIGQLAAFEEPGTAIALTEAAVLRDCFGAQRKFRVLMAEAEAGPCGLVTLLDGYSSWAAAPTLIVHDLFVMEMARGLGVGRLLLAEAARLALAEGCCRLDVNVVSWNAAAMGFYRSLGFAPQENWRPFRLDAAALAALGGQTSGA
jgi:GNAT superfamily N-acetyltransferase